MSCGSSTASNTIQKDVTPFPGNVPDFPQTAAGSSGPGIWPKIFPRPDLKFTVYVYSHIFSSGPRGKLPCWTYISKGLHKVAQPEIIFTLLRRQDENEEQIPDAPVEWMRFVFALASDGVNLETGQMCNLVFAGESVYLKLNQMQVLQPPNTWVTMKRFGVLLHGGYPLSDSVFKFPEGTLPRGAHHVIALTHEEAAVARQFGCTRVIGHVGLSVRWFPNPLFIDRDREDCVVMADQSGSVRTRMSVTRMYGLNAMLENNEIVLTIPEGEIKRNLFKRLVIDPPLNAVFSCESFVTEEADCGLIWKSGQTKPMAYGNNCSSMERRHLAFLTFAPEQDNDSSIMVEDGYGILLRDTTWKKIRDAIQSFRDVSVNLEDGMRFRLQWKKTIYHNPIDGSEYRANWTPYNGKEAPPPSKNSHVLMDSVILLVQPPKGHIEVEELTAYINQVVAVVENTIPVTPIQNQGDGSVGRQLVIEIEIPKCKGWLKMSAYPSMNGLPSMQIFPQIATLVQPQCLSRFKFQLMIRLWGYDGPSAQFS